MKWLVLSDGYHGRSDIWTSLTPPALGVPPDQYVKQLPDDYTDDLLSSSCAVIIEPVKLDVSETRKTWLRKLRDDCTRLGVVLIFDEVVTGFRVPKYTVSSWFGITPDLITMGKAAANGIPFSFVAGTKTLTDCGEYFLSSTFSGNALSLAACKATLEVLRTKNMDDLYFYANRFQDRLNSVLRPLECSFTGYGTRAMFGPWHEKSACFVQQCAKAGVLFGKAFFYNFAHLESNIEELVLNIASDAVSSIEAGRVRLEGPIPTETFKR